MMFRRRLLTAICSLLLLAGLTPGLQGAAAQDDPSRTVNLQLIVDSSGSMAAPTDTGIARMDSARTVLNQVISSLPDTEGVNVGFRVYGQGGDNTEAGRAESCVSSDLVVPMDGVDVTALTDEVDALQPVGWTPLAYALEEARGDFEDEAGDDVVNAIVMVTDGLETCDGDPVEVAGDLRTSDLGIVTNVIGFGTTAEEQDILSGIAEEGGGELYSSSNAGQLISAVFDILEDLNVVAETGSGETRDSPLGIGRTADVGDYEVTVLSVTPDATDLVAESNPYGDPPAAGDQYFIARVSITYTGSETGDPSFELNFQSVGDSSSSYTVFDNSCGLYEGTQYDVTELFEGGSAEFDVCWAINSEDADSLVMYVEPLLDFDADPVWFALGNPIESVVTEGATPVAEESEEPAPTRAARPSATGDDPADSIETTRTDPLPVGETTEVGDYEVTVLSVTPDATDFVAESNPYGDPAASGDQYFIARVAITYIGATSGNPSFELNFQSVGDSSSSYTVFDNSCGLYEGTQYDVTELFEGGSAEFNVCWAINSEDADSLVMYVEPLFDFDADPVWFSLDD